MSILSTNTKLIKVGQEYSAGSGISIDDYVISVTGYVGGKTYSAGDNIGIYTQDNQLYISGKDWEQDIANASANAYNAATAQIPAPQDLSYLSGRIDTNTSGIDYISSVCITSHQDWTDTIKGASSYSYEQSTSYFDNWLNGQYTGDITNITNKISALSGDFDNYYKKTETSSKDEINDALQYVSANAGKVYEGVSPIVVNNVEDKISADTWTFSAGSNVSFVDDAVNKITRIDCTVTGTGGDPQVNSFVYNNSATINEVNTTYQSNSGSYQPSGNYIPYTAVDEVFNSFKTNSGLDVTTAIADSLRITSLREDFITVAYINSHIGINNRSTLTTKNLTFKTSSNSAYVDMEKIHTWDSASNYIQNNSSTWNEVSNVVQTNSAQWAEGGVTGEFVPQSAFDELKASYGALSSLFATYSGQWLLPNEGV